jgi:hypothetical protein
MKNFTYTVLNTGIRLICVGMSVHILVKCVIGLSVKSATLYNINAYIVVSALMFVMCVVRHSVKRAV